LAFVETASYERFMTPEQAREVLDSVNDFHPLGRHGYPDDVIEAIVFLASERARWSTGTRWWRAKRPRDRERRSDRSPTRDLSR
jgi:NAD(P)-dependent dehydrogenase (short-subunit alcohol dehydrogenase family)